jgi:hypothetical protein
LFLLLRMWQGHLTTWNKSKYLHLLHLQSKVKIGVPASSRRSVYNPYYYGKDNAPIAHPFEITISESIYLNSPMHWILDISQLKGSSHPGDESQRQRSIATSSPGHLLDAWWQRGRRFGSKTSNQCCCLCCTGLTGALNRSDRCLLADESCLVII